MPRIPLAVARVQLTLVPPLPEEDSLDSFGRESKPKQRRAKTTPAKSYEKAVARAAAMAKSGDWFDAKPLDFVALFVVMHKHVYGVAPAMSPRDHAVAESLAKACLKSQFDDEAQDLADFVWWTWRREKEREQYRRENGRDGGSISWALQFSNRLMTDYKISRVREEQRKGNRR